MTTPLSRRKFLGLGAGALAVPGLALFTPQVSAMSRLPTPPPQFIGDVNGVANEQILPILSLGNTLLRDYDLAGLSLAMSFRGGQNVTACFGVANKEAPTGMQPHHKFRVASVSKPVTAVAVLRLMEQGRLGLDDRVFAPEGQLRGFLASGPGMAVNLARLEDITIRHLLQHRAGGWPNDGTDPMFVPATFGMNQRQLISWTLLTRPLVSNPGDQYSYSNFGFCLLGRVIEAVTGQSYGEAVNALVLSRVGSAGMQIGRPGTALPNEVRYYDSRHDPYGPRMDPARMDSHGGWVSSAGDLVSFAEGLAGFGASGGLLQASTLQEMTTRADPADQQALGWLVTKGGNWWHPGAMDGTYSMMARTATGRCFAVLANTRSYDPAFAKAFDRFPWAVRDALVRGSALSPGASLGGGSSDDSDFDLDDEMVFDIPDLAIGPRA